MVVIATDAERSLIEPGRTDEVLVTGVGALNIMQALDKLPRNTEIVNYGYAGSNSIKIGEKVTVGPVRLYHPLVEYVEPEYDLHGGTPCYTSCDFVCDTEISDPCVFDMELAFILAMGFTNVRSVKTVSDNLSLSEYERTICHGKAKG